ncbi:MAG: ATP-grasp domain-containing protein [Acidobacteria bacterium]|nr:ATP-grasp domain-containing protein [Acidobacteriota bacterium]
MRAIRKVLVANRGEIACRVIRTLREMGIASLAVHSDVDRDAPHVWMADEAVGLGAPRSYLDATLIITAGQRAGASAVHPGYGFLAENAQFAAACEDAGLVFIGPSPAAMRALGDKRAARKAAEDIGVPVVPGARQCDSPDAAAAAADRVGYPVLIKAAGGGGGKGMRRVHSREEIKEAFAGARREAHAAFSDDRLLVEKYIHPARHVEVQILGDGVGAVALGERECSLQRRYQKVIEESPSPGIDARTRSRLCEAAVKLAAATGYANAGTVEFLVGPDGAFYFLEVNTRLQVEHPVTEAVTGLDLVRSQIEIASGGALPVPPDPRGHAIEARLNAEDPYSQFLPSTGKILMLDWPTRPQTRIDSGIVQGSEVHPFYDSLLAKIICWGQDREQARRRLVTALRETTILGVHTSQAFIIQLLESEELRSGATHTTTIESRSWEPAAVPAEVLQLAARSAHTPAVLRTAGGALCDQYSPWHALGGFRMGA